MSDELVNGIIQFHYSHVMTGHDVTLGANKQSRFIDLHLNVQLFRIKMGLIAFHPSCSS